MDADGNVLSMQAHERAGTGHAEARVLTELRERGLIERAHTLLITLEPCNHYGRTPPCTEAILAATGSPRRGGIQRVIFGTPDPNPSVAGGGAERLKQAGLLVELAPLDIQLECRELLAPFAHRVTTGLPWVVVKTAHRSGFDPADPRSMIPPEGQKTFTSPEALRLAHELRRRADAIITGSGTILADHPLFTVRHVPDHAVVTSGIKPRKVVVIDRRGRTPESWVQEARIRGFEVWIRSDLRGALEELGTQGTLEVLVEAGPTLSTAVIQSGFCQRHVLLPEEGPPCLRELSKT